VSAVIGFARELAGHPEGLPELPYAWLEAPLEAVLARTREVADWQDLRRWPEGRLFGEAGEYRWQKLGDGELHSVLLLAEGPLPPGFGGEVELEPVGTAASRMLWGEWVDPQEDRAANPDGGPRFYAPPIPGVQVYPVELGQPPHAHKEAELLVQAYRDKRGEKGDFLRCVALRTVLRPAEEAENG
jgi:hypothetical protein